MWNWIQSKYWSAVLNNKILAILAILSLASNPSFCQYTINKTSQDERLIVSTMDLIYNFQFEEAHKQINEVKIKFKEHPIYHFLSAMICYWEMVPISIDNPKYKVYEYHLLKTIELSEKMINNRAMEQEATYYIMAANSSLIVIYLKAKDFGKAITEARKTYAFMKEGFNWGDKYPDFNFSSGIYYFYAEQYPETHPIIQPMMWFFTKGDKEKGIAYLRKSAENAIFSRTESIYFLAHLHLKYTLSFAEGLKFTTKLVEKYPNNYFYLARHTEALVLCKKYAEAKICSEKLLKNQTDYFQISGHLFSGMVDLNSNNIVSAKKHFEMAEKLALTSKKQTTDYLAFTYLGLGKIAEKEGNLKKSDSYFDKVNELGEYKILGSEVNAFKARKKQAKKHN